MASNINRLTSKQVSSLGAGKYADGGGLWLYKRSGEKLDGRWVLRITINGARREMGLGGVAGKTLAQARSEAAQWRAMAAQGMDPIRARERQRHKEHRNLRLLSDVALDAFESRKADLKGDGKDGRWFSPLALHVLPKLGGMPVSDIDQIDIRDTIAPIWHAKSDTATKAISRLHICFKHAAALGVDVDLQAVSKARELLGRQRRSPKHIPALPWREVPAFYASLDGGFVSHLALRLLILTGSRSKPVRYMHTDQIDGDLWTVPGDLMKGRRGAAADFRVPLSDEAMMVVDEARGGSRDGFLFPGIGNSAISDGAMCRVMMRLGMDARPHGFRSSFRDWAAEATRTSYDVAETALGHVVGGKVERAYRRTDYIEQRRVLMQMWGRLVSGQSADVIALRSL